MTNYLLQVKDEETFFQKVRKIVKEELTNSKGQPQEHKASIPYIKVDEVIRILHVSRPTINDWVSKGYFKKYKVNSRTYYNRDEILDFLSEQSK
ncbi:MAG: helix-turn-helix domain-containing protein [Bacteroidales bacterium]|nr:helix-turn-helix domain-containing protein [Bacteroidales bacterium]